jgi:hypothetical protein
MTFRDFVIKYDPKKDKPIDITRRILYSIVINRLKHKKPAVLFISGDSGEGKSFGALRLQELLLEIQGMKLEDLISDINVYVPIEYPRKINKLLGLNPGGYKATGLKDANIICVHEARELVKAKNWHSFINTAISDVNAMSRSIKRLCVMIVSQFIRDISSDIRYTLNYYVKVSRPIGKKARLYFYVMWKDDTDLEKPKLKKRKLTGYLVYPNGVYRKYTPKYLELRKPKKENVEKFEKQDTEAKAKIIRHKINKLVKEMGAEMDLENEKVNLMVEHYVKNPQNLTSIGRQYRDKWKLKPDVRKMYELSKEEAVDFERKLNEQLIKKGVVEDGE